MHSTNDREQSDSDDTFYSMEDGKWDESAERVEEGDEDQLSEPKCHQDRTEVIENDKLRGLNPRCLPEGSSSQPLSDILNLYITDEDDDDDDCVRSMLDNSNVDERFSGNSSPKRSDLVVDSSIIEPHNFEETIFTSANDGNNMLPSTKTYPNDKHVDKSSHSFTSLANIIEIADDGNKRDTLNEARHSIADAPIVEFDGSKEVIIISSDEDTDVDDVTIGDEMCRLKRSRSITSSPPRNSLEEELPQSPYQKKLKILENLAKKKAHRNREGIDKNGLEPLNKCATDETHGIATIANKNDDCDDSDENFFNYP